MRWIPQEPSGNSELRVPATGRATLRSLGLAATLLLVLVLLPGAQRSRTDDRAAASVGASLPLAGQASPASPQPPDHMMAASVSSMFDATQNTWTRLFASMGKRYIESELVLFRHAVESGCGHSQPAMGSFYCPIDRKAYVDLGVYGELRERFGRTGDLVQAYVLAHEIGHHVQTLLSLKQRDGQLGAEQPAATERLSTRFELQADCLAGVSWYPRTTRSALGRDDIGKAVRAAVVIGVHESPEALTHGSPAQRVNSFRLGFESGQVSSCTRTTVRLDDEALSERARREAARRRVTLTSLIEQGLRLVLREPLKRDDRSRVALPECRAGGGTLPGVDLDDSAALLDRMGGRN